MGHHCHCNGKCYCHGHHCIFGIFLAFLGSVIWLLIAVMGYTSQAFGILGLGNLGHIIFIIIVLIGILAFLVFGLFLFKKAWRCCR